MEKSLKILLVEDNAVNQKVASLILKHIGYDCSIADNGKEAIQAIEADHYDVVLMDLSMPVMDGIEAAKIIKEKFPNPPVLIALTAHAMGEEIEKCKAVGFSDYATKPIDKVELKRILDNITVS
jgi:CheY-like chemotaxis protein